MMRLVIPSKYEGVRLGGRPRASRGTSIAGSTAGVGFPRLALSRPRQRGSIALARNWVLPILLTLALAAFSAAQSEFNPKPPEVTATPVGRVSVAPGSAVNVPFKFWLSHGYHINSNIPRSELLIPTVLTLQSPSPQVTIRLTYPKGEDVAFDFEPDMKLSVYEGEFIITARVRAARAAKPGVHTVRGTLKYQACNDRSCFPPKAMPVEFEVEVTKPAASRAASGR